MSSRLPNLQRRTLHRSNRNFSPLFCLLKVPVTAGGLFLPTRFTSLYFPTVSLIQSKLQINYPIFQQKEMKRIDEFFSSESTIFR
jgi:hypothetical protein